MSLDPLTTGVLAGGGAKDRMRIGVVGAGMIGHALAVRFAAAGHEVMLSNSRGPDTLAEVVGSIQGTVRAIHSRRPALVVALAITVSTC